jgi:hypothetical protein
MISFFGTCVPRPRLPVIPQSRCSRRPAESELDINVCLVHIIQVVQNDITLRLVQPNDSIGHGAIHPKRFPPRSRVNSYQRMSPLDVLWPGCWVLSIKIRVCRSVHGVLPVDNFAEARRQLLVRSVPAGPEGIPSNWRDRIIVKVRHSSWLSFMNEIRMPSRRTSWFAEVGWILGRLQSGPDYSHTWNTRDLRDLWLEKSVLEPCVRINYSHEFQSRHTTSPVLSVAEA